jgi:serine phosphatase RsbU (regulator of sigma subunit)
MDGRRPVLGVSPVRPYRIGERSFTSGSTFLAYTDGLVERRDEDLLVSVNRLAADLAPKVRSVEELADGLLAAHAPDGAVHDDLALVVVHAVDIAAETDRDAGPRTSATAVSDS